MKYFLKCLKNYAVFDGRATRSEYWYFFLFNLIFAVISAIIDELSGTTFHIGSINLHYGYVYLIYGLAIFAPSLAVTVRRLHDVGKSGWFYFIILIPFVGAVWLLVLACTDSNPGENKYGPNPKGIVVVE